jgi:hypothetical protein
MLTPLCAASFGLFCPRYKLIAAERNVPGAQPVGLHVRRVSFRVAILNFTAYWFDFVN